MFTICLLLILIPVRAQKSVFPTPCWGLYDCLFEEPEGYIQSPGYPRYDLDNTTFRGTIRLRTDNRILLGFKAFDVSHKWKGVCTIEGVDIYDDFEVSNRLIDRFCGKTIPPPIMTTGPNLHFTAYTQTMFRGRGFLAHYSADTCGRRISNDWGFFASPNYSFEVPKNVSCQWTVEAQTDDVIAIEFIHINISGRLMANCNDAIIQVTGIRTENETFPLATFCAHERSPEPIIGKFQQTVILLKTSSLATGTGFVARYTRYRDHYTLMAELNHSQHEDRDGIIKLEPYKGHGVTVMRTGTITQPTNQRMMLYYKTFQLRGPSEYGVCKDEYFELYDGPSSFYPLIGKYCGSDIPPIVVSSVYALFYRAKMHSDSSLVVIRYKPITCGSTIMVRTSGYFVSPGYPLKLPPNLSCHWRLIPSEGLPMVVEFSDIHMPPLWTWCSYTYAALSGTTATGEVVNLGRFCDSGRNYTVMGAFKHLDINLVTANQVIGIGFKAHYKMECGYWLSNSGEFQSPGRTDWHNTGFVCWWGLQIPFGKRIFLDINIQLDSDAKPDEPCLNEIVKVYDGPAKGWPLLMLTCGTQHRQIMSRGELLLVQYLVGNSKPKLTFTASFQPVNCGYWLSKSGSFTSVPYLRYHECWWGMRAGKKKQIKLLLEIRSTEDHQQNKDCNEQAVIIHDGSNRAAKNFTWLCDPMCAVFVSSGEKLLLRHRAIASRPSFNFWATFKEESNGPQPGMTVINLNGLCPRRLF